jgi:hypothetical protein
VHILDLLGCCIAALGAGPVQACREQAAEFGGTGPCALIAGCWGNSRTPSDQHRKCFSPADVNGARTSSDDRGFRFGENLMVAGGSLIVSRNLPI